MAKLRKVAVILNLNISAYLDEHKDMIGNQNVWIGFSDSDKLGTFTWSDKSYGNELKKLLGSCWSRKHNVFSDKFQHLFKSMLTWTEHYGKSMQESTGIRQWSINWCTFPMLIHKIALSIDYN